MLRTKKDSNNESFLSNSGSSGDEGYSPRHGNQAPKGNGQPGNSPGVPVTQQRLRRWLNNGGGAFTSVPFLYQTGTPVIGVMYSTLFWFDLHVMVEGGRG